ncbi:MAG: hypothetical protein OEV49_12705 [candidate division Zixibacteria bacterium]|nr:hypothetical protein [candidate division Zixibacteria bacterium]MDH3937810.1 hypothetical protein [candidate division Zixibacteria bacterium]
MAESEDSTITTQMMLAQPRAERSRSINFGRAGAPNGTFTLCQVWAAPKARL